MTGVNVPEETTRWWELQRERVKCQSQVNVDVEVAAKRRIGRLSRVTRDEALALYA